MADIGVQSRKKKDKKGKRRGHATVNNEDANNSFDEDDSASVVSACSSESQYALEEEENGLDYVEDFEGKLIENIEGSRQKGTNGRHKCLNEVVVAFRKRYVNEFIEDRVDTIVDITEKLLKRGQGQDRIFASKIACLLCIQLNEGDATKVFTTLKSPLITLISDDSLAPSIKSEACAALGMACFIADVEMEDMVECLNVLKTAFCKKIPSDSSHHCAFANALSAWSLILTIANGSIVSEQILSCIGTMCKLLELGSLNLRIAAGETTALVFELAYQNRLSLQGPRNTLFELLRELANESGRHKGKREKKQQKSSFRDIVKSVEGNCPPDSTIKFGAEYIQMTSWEWLRMYSAFKEALGPGTNIHLQTNPLIREIFDLGPPISREMQQSKASKYEKQLLNSVSSKTRTQKRNMKRDNKKNAAGI